MELRLCTFECAPNRGAEVRALSVVGKRLALGIVGKRLVEVGGRRVEKTILGVHIPQTKRFEKNPKHLFNAIRERRILQHGSRGRCFQHVVNSFFNMFSTALSTAIIDHIYNRSRPSTCPPKTFFQRVCCRPLPSVFQRHFGHVLGHCVVQRYMLEKGGVGQVLPAALKPIPC